MTGDKGLTSTHKEVTILNQISETRVEVWRSGCRLSLRAMAETTRTEVSVMEKSKDLFVIFQKKSIALFFPD